MSLREKFAWIALIAVLVSVGLYGVVLVLGANGVIRQSMVFFSLLGLLAALIAVPPAIRGILAMRMPQGAMTEQDERERLFELKATRIAFFVLAISVLVFTFFTVHGPSTRRDIAHGVLAATVLAYLVKFGTEIRYHRRGY